jgi:hypothetical protein
MSRQPIRIWRVPKQVFGPRELETAAAAMTPEILGRIAERGFTGVWTLVRLRDVVRTDVFPELGADAASQQAVLADCSARCRAAGLKLYLYLNEPRAFADDDPIWEAHPELRGFWCEAFNDNAIYGWPKSRAMCTSVPLTRCWLETACAGLFRCLPDLGGIVCITASEHLTHCYSRFDVTGCGLGEHFGQRPGDVLNCPRCRDREPTDVLREVLETIERGVHGTAPEADVIAWTWSWDLMAPAPQAELIASLPPGIIVMPDNERGGELEWQGQRLAVDEYSLNYIGPSPRARGQIEAARRSGKRAMARFQVNHTIECATAPNWPLIANLYRKLAALGELGVTDVMASWNFGSNPDTLNCFAFDQFWRRDATDEDDFLRSVAEDYFGLPDGSAVAKAWQAFGEAVRSYAFGFGMLYFSPFNRGCAYPLPDYEPRQQSMIAWHMDFREPLGDMLEQCVAFCGLAAVIDRLGIMQERWTEAVKQYEPALAPAAQASRGEQERNVACYFGHLLHSAWVLFSWLAWRHHPDAVAGLDTAVMRARLEAEQTNLAEVAALLERDPRLGFYEEAQRYYVTPDGVRAKGRADAAIRARLG